MLLILKLVSLWYPNGKMAYLLDENEENCSY